MFVFAFVFVFLCCFRCFTSFDLSANCRRYSSASDLATTTTTTRTTIDSRNEKGQAKENEEEPKGRGTENGYRVSREIHFGLEGFLYAQLPPTPAAAVVAAAAAAIGDGDTSFSPFGNVPLLEATKQHQGMARYGTQ